MVESLQKGIFLLLAAVLVLSANAQCQGKDIRLSGVIFRQTLSKRKIFLGEQLVVSTTLLSPKEIRQYAFDTPSYDGFWIENLRSAKQALTKINGRHYEVVQGKTSLYATRLGSITINPRRVLVRVSYQRISDSYLDRGRIPLGPTDLLEVFKSKKTEKLELFTKSRKVFVREPPAASQQVTFWDSDFALVGITKLAIEYPAEEITVGLEKELTVNVVSYGNINPLRKVPLAEPQMLKFYHHTPELIRHERQGKLAMEKIFKITMVAKEPGRVSIAGPRIGYFDPAAEEYRESRAADIEFVIKPVGSEVVPAVESDQQKQELDETNSASLRRKSWILQVTERLSPATVLLVVVVCLLLFLGLRVFYRLDKLVAPRRSLRKRVEQADTAQQMEDCFAVLLQRWFGAASVGSGTDRLKGLLAASQIEKSIQLRILLLQDQISELAGADPPCPSSRLSQLKSELLQLIEL